MLGLPASVTACMFDPDGVLTQTARVRATAWEEMFDAYRRHRAARTGEPFVPVDPRGHYDAHHGGPITVSTTTSVTRPIRHARARKPPSQGPGRTPALCKPPRMSVRATVGH